MSGSTGYKPSGFLTNFTSSTGLTDMLSTVSTSIPVDQSGETGYARYFCLGNLLIQFSDGIRASRNQGTSYIQDYPTTFSSTPYTVLISYTNLNNNGGYATLESKGTTGFEFRVGGNDGNITWLAIGPR